MSIYIYIKKLEIIRKCADTWWHTQGGRNRRVWRIDAMKVMERGVCYFI